MKGASGIRAGCTMQDTGCRMGQCPPLPSRILHTPCVGFSKTGTRYGFQVSGTGYRIRCSAFGSRPSVWMKNAGRSYLPCPSSLHGRGPNTEHRRPSPAPGKRAHRVCTLGVPHPGHRPIALLPYCLTALLPYCLTALLPYCLPAPHRFDPADGSGYDRGRSQPGPGSPYRGEKGKGCKSPAVPPP
jgi:hypothetical protein